MSTIFKTVTGDTFETIAKKQYGDGSKSQVIASANPGANEPLTVGISIVIPSLQNEPTNKAQLAPSENQDEVAILIDGKRFRFWTDVSITRSLDQMATVEFSAPFNEQDQTFRDTFRPFSYKRCEITVGGEPLFAGTMVGVSPNLGENKTVQASCYSLPGVLNDCTPPASSFPLEFNDQGLREIASTLISPFGLDLVFDVDQGAVFERVACNAGQRVLSFLSELAKQRNLVISSNEAGAVVFWNSIAGGNPVAVLEQGQSPLSRVQPSFSPQEYYSHLTGIEPVFIGLGGSQYTVQNPRLKGVLRPITFTVPDTPGADVQAAVSAKASRMFGNAASYSIEVSTWRDPQGKLWTPNTTIKLIAPNAMIYSSYEFIIRSVQLNRAQKTTTATLDLVLPGSFSGETPEVLPWEE